MVNLIVDLRDEKYSPAVLEQSLKHIKASGFSYVEAERPGDSALAWIDQEFGGTWSSEAFAGKNIVVTEQDRFAGFVTYDPRGLNFAWLRAWRSQPDVGFFGPFGVARAHRGSPLGKHLLTAALCLLRIHGYDRALIPAVASGRLSAYYQEHAGAKVVEEFDPALLGRRRSKTTVLASGSGTNFQAVLDAVRDGRLPLQIEALASNNPNAFALARAERAGVPTRVVIPWDRKVESRQTYDRRLIHAVEQTEPELVLLLGWMHVLSEQFFSRFEEVINIHPAFLPLDQARDVVGMPDGAVVPAFRGAHAIRDALLRRCAWVGATAHRVCFETDRGSILTRKPLAIDSEMSEAEVMIKLRPIEHSVLLGGITRWVYES